MPYFYWTGIDIYGQDRTGKQFAQSTGALEQLLLKDEIALLCARPMRQMSIFSRITDRDWSKFFDYVGSLAASGVRLHDALTLSLQAIKNTKLKHIIACCTEQVGCGEKLSKALLSFQKDQKDLKNIEPLIVALISAGEESGDIPRVCQALGSYYQERFKRSAHMKSILFLPILTFILFCLITILVFVFVMPRFESMFALFGADGQKTHELYKYGLIHSLFSISSFIRSSRFIVLVIGFISFIFVLYMSLRVMCRAFFSRLILSLPIVGTLIKTYSLSMFFQTLEILVKSDVHLAKALEIAKNTQKNVYIKDKCTELYTLVNRGILLSVAYRDIFGASAYARKHCIVVNRECDEVEALMVLGQASGKLDQALERIVFLHQEKIKTFFETLSRIVPIIVLLCLALFVGMLVIVVYSPLMSFSHIIK